MAQTDVLTTRSAFRDELRRDLLERASDFYRDLTELTAPVAETASIDVPTGDETNGHSDLDVPRKAVVQVLTRRAFIDLVNQIFEIPLPPPSEHHAEVSTPAKVLVAAECPKCGIAQPIEVAISPELLVDPDGSELRIKAKAKGRSHTCGQLPLPDAAEEDHDDGQLTLDQAEQFVVELVPDAEPPTDLLDDDSEAEDCKVTGVRLTGEAIQCYRAADHDGHHYDADSQLTWRLVPLIVAVVDAGEAIGETLPNVTNVLLGELEVVDEVLGTGEPVEEAETLPDGDARIEAAGPLECVGSNHVPGCEHMGGEVPKREGLADLSDLPF